MKQVQCPNCGGYRTEVSGKFAKNLVAIIVQVLSSIISLGAAGLGLLVWYVDNHVYSYLLCGSALLIGVASSLISLGLRNSIKVNLYECELCGFSWDASKISPGHVIQPNIELIQRGNQRNEEQRRRMD